MKPANFLGLVSVGAAFSIVACGEAASPGVSESDAGSEAGVTDAPSLDAGATPDGRSTNTELTPNEAVARAREVIASWCTGSSISSDPEECQRRKALCRSGTLRDPYLTHHRAFTCIEPGCSAFADKGTYYLVPVDREDGTTPCVVAIALKHEKLAVGEYMATKYGEPIHYLPIPRERAATALEDHLAASSLPVPAELPAPTLQDYPMIRASGFSLFFPFWVFALDGKEWFVDQQGKVYDSIVTESPGGAGGGPTH